MPKKYGTIRHILHHVGVDSEALCINQCGARAAAIGRIVVMRNWARDVQGELDWDRTASKHRTARWINALMDESAP